MQKLKVIFCTKSFLSILNKALLNFLFTFIISAIVADPALTKWFHGYDSWLMLGPSHTKDFKIGSGSCLYCTQYEVGTTKHNWSVTCQYNVTGWVSMWAYCFPICCRVVTTSGKEARWRPSVMKQQFDKRNLLSS